jgi:hypothetical protein
MWRFSSQILIKMNEAIEILKKELYSVEYLYSNYERANVLKHVDSEGMQKKIEGLKYSIAILENKLS